MKRRHQEPQSRDPYPYDGPIQRADGTRPFNRYLWNTEWWWAHRELNLNSISSRWEFGIVALADGRWATEGFVRSIERDLTMFGLRCCFPTRDEAIRAKAGRLIRLARTASGWIGPDKLSENNCAIVIHWIRTVVARETGAAAPPPLRLKPVEVAPAKTGLPLFDAMVPR